MDAYPDRTFSGRVLQIRKSPEIVQNVVTYTTIISAPNPDLLLLPGMTAQLRIAVSDTGEDPQNSQPGAALPAKRCRLLDPVARVRTKFASPKASATVWVIGDDGRPNPVAVKLGASDDNGAALLEGPLTEGQPVIIGVASSQNHRGYFGVRLGF